MEKNCKKIIYSKFKYKFLVDVNLESDKFKFDFIYSEYCKNTLNGYLNALNTILNYEDDKDKLKKSLQSFSNFFEKSSKSLFLYY